MRKIFKSMAVAMIMVCSMAVSIFASPADDLSKELLAMGVPSSYVGTIVEYLQKTTISEADYNKAMGYVNQAKAIIGNTKDISKLSNSDKLALKNLATKAGNVLGLNVEFGKDAKGVTTLVVTDAKGGTILKMNTLDALEVVTNFEPTEVVELLETMVEFSNNADKGEFDPVGGDLTQTATPYANMMVAGAVMIAVAGGIVLVSKKQFA